MRKTFLKVALIGALAVAMPSTFTSCKDYDTDIENLNTQTADLKTQLASVNAAIAALPTKADVSAAQAAAVAQAKSDLNAVKAQLEAAIAGKADQATVDAINTELSAIKGQLETIEALKGDIQTALESVNNAITELKEDAVTKGQMDAALEAQKAELQEYADGKVGTLVEDVAALQSAVNDPTSGIAALKAQIEELAQKINGETGGEGATSLEAVIRLLNGMITHIEVVENGDFDPELDLFVMKAAATTDFGKLSDGTELPGMISFKAGEEQIINDQLLVRVSPANAVVTPSQIQIVNSKGEDMSAFINVASVEAYTDLMTSRSISNNGLHIVKLAMNENCDAKAYAAATTSDGNDVLFAVAIADSAEELAAGREITSAYNVTINSEAPKSAYNLLYNVEETPIAQIKNRFVKAEDGSEFAYSTTLIPQNAAYAPMQVAYDNGVAIPTANAAFMNVGDYYYSKNPSTGALEIKWANATTGTSAKNDNRQAQPLLPVALGKAFQVEMSGDNVYALYVVLDKLRATESNGSELTAWNSYESNISGINQVIVGKKANISLNMSNVVNGEVLGFRVWAVNYDGTLVDPDGRAFYVKVGETSDDDDVEVTGEVSFTVTPTVTGATNTNAGVQGATPNWIAALNFASAVVDGSSQVKGSWLTQYTSVYATVELNTEDNPAFGAGSTVSVMGASSNGTGATINAPFAAKFKSMAITLSDGAFQDGVKYTALMKIYSQKGGVLLQTLALNFTKVIPTTGLSLPANLVTVVPGQLGANDQIDAYVNYTAPATTSRATDPLTASDYSVAVAQIFEFEQPKTNAAGTVTNQANLDLLKALTAQINYGADPAITNGNSQVYTLTDFTDADAEILVAPFAINNGTKNLTFSINSPNASYKENPNGELAFNTDLKIQSSFKINFKTKSSTLSFDWGSVEDGTDKDGNPVVVSNAPVLVQGIGIDADATATAALTNIWVKSTLNGYIKPDVTVAGYTSYTELASLIDNGTLTILEEEEGDATVAKGAVPTPCLTGNIAKYFTVSYDATSGFTFTPITMNPINGTLSGNLVFKVKGDDEIPVTITLPLTMVSGTSQE